MVHLNQKFKKKIPGKGTAPCPDPFLVGGDYAPPNGAFGARPFTKS